MAIRIFVKRVFSIFATNAAILHVIANLQIQLSMKCNIYHVIVYFLPKKHCFGPKKITFFCPSFSKKYINCDNICHPVNQKSHDHILEWIYVFCGTPAVWLRLPLQDKHNNSDGHTITMEDSFLSSHMSSTYSDCLLYTDVPVSVNTLFSLFLAVQDSSISDLVSQSVIF